MRHALPSGDFAPIIGRALDLLIEDLMKKRFGAGARRKPPSPVTLSVGSSPSSTALPPVGSSPSSRAVLSDAAVLSDTVAPCDTAKPSEPAPSDAPQPSYPAKVSVSNEPSVTENARNGAGARVTTNSDAGTTPSENDEAGTTLSDVALRASQGVTSRHVRRAARRSVLERDGLRCGWVDAGGTRCDSRAWLEHDHRQPLGKGGDSEPENLRLLCRAHNFFGRGTRIWPTLHAARRGSEALGTSAASAATAPELARLAAVPAARAVQSRSKVRFQPRGLSSHARRLRASSPHQRSKTSHHARCRSAEPRLVFASDTSSWMG